VINFSTLLSTKWFLTRWAVPKYTLPFKLCSFKSESYMISEWLNRHQESFYVEGDWIENFQFCNEKSLDCFLIDKSFDCFYNESLHLFPVPRKVMRPSLRCRGEWLQGKRRCCPSRRRDVPLSRVPRELSEEKKFQNVKLISFSLWILCLHFRSIKDSSMLVNREHSVKCCSLELELETFKAFKHSKNGRI
jgi:hypothetical protein